MTQALFEIVENGHKQRGEWSASQVLDKMRQWLEFSGRTDAVEITCLEPR